MSGSAAVAADEENNVAAVAAVNQASAFCSRASASLSAAVDSIWGISGDKHGNIGNIIEIEAKAANIECTASTN